MRIMRKQHLILAFFAICKNFMCCSASLSNRVPQCKTADDVNPPFCKIEQLESKVLIDLCKSIGYKHHIPNPTREEIVTIASMCQMIKDETDNALNYIDGDEMKEAARKEMLETILSDSSNMFDKYLKSADTIQQLLVDGGHHWCERVEDLDHTLCKFEDLRDDVLIDMCDEVGYHHEPNPTRAKIVMVARNYCFHTSLLVGDAITKRDLLNSLQDAENYAPSVECNTVDDIDVEDINHSICTYEDLRDEVLIDMCKRVGYHQKPNTSRGHLALAATMCSIGKILPMDDIKRFLLADMVKEALENDDVVESLYKSHLSMMKDASYFGMSRHDKISYMLSKHGIEDMALEKKVRVKMGTLLHEKLEEEDLYLTLGIDTMVKEQWIERYIPTSKEIAKLPDWYSYKPVIKGEAIKFKIFRKDGDAVTSKWKTESQTWSNPRSISTSNYSNRLFVDFMRKSMQYENVLLFQSDSDGGESGQQLSKETLVIGFNHGDELHSTAMRVLGEYKLRDNKLRYTHGDDEAISGAHLLMSITDFLLKYASEATPPAGKSPSLILLGCLVFVLLVMYGFSLLLVPKRKRKKAMKLNPKKSPLLCHQPVIKKTIYVKSFAIKRLNRGNRLNGIVTRSRAQDIQIERKTGQPTDMYKIKASNGEIYVPVHMKGSEEAVQKAVVLIQEAVGTENLDEEIELPPTNPKQATSPKPKSTTTSKISSSAPVRIPSKKKKKESLSSTLWSSVCASCQYLKEISINTYQSATNYIGKGTVITVTVLYLVLYIMVYWKVDCKLLRQSDMTNYHFHCDSDLFCTNDTKTKVAFVWLVICSAVVLVLRTIAYGISLMLKYDARMTKSLIIIFGILCCTTCLVIIWACDKITIERHSIEYRAAFVEEMVCQPVQNYIFILLLILLFLSGMILLILRGVSYSISLVNKYTGILRMPFDFYHTKKTKQTIYIKTNKSKNLSGKQGRKKKEIISKSGVDDIQIDTSAVGDNYVEVYLKGSRRSVWEGIDLIREAVGTEYVSVNKPSSLIPALMIPQPQTSFILYDTNPVREPTATVSRSPVQDVDVHIESETAASIGMSNGSEPIDKGGSNDTPESPVQCDTMNNSGNNLAKEVATVESSPAKVVQEEEIASEIGVDSSSQGMTTRETITEASISSFNDRSSISKAPSSFTLDENDPLLIFLRSQESCIKGSVDEFYTWLVKSEDIDSMLALKEAVSEDDYLLNDMKVGDGGGSGVKGFKRKVFLRAISEYFNNKSDTKTAEVHQSLPQCQKKNLSETLEPPEELVCPISLNLMTNDPVVAADGITYERSSIEDWFKKSKSKISKAQENLKQNPHSEADQRIVNNGICSPVYGSKLKNSALVPNTVVRNMARSFKVTAKEKSSIG